MKESSKNERLESSLTDIGCRTKISFEELENLVCEYHALLERYPLQINTNGINFVNVIKLVKRDTKNQIGPYKNITLFEALNRIATNLVTLHGLLQLIDDKVESKDSLITICLGNENHIEGDFEINGKHGEAFNASSSFLKVKLRSTLKKWENKLNKKGERVELTYILYNGELQDEIKGVKCGEVKLISVNNWDKEYVNHIK